MIDHDDNNRLVYDIVFTSHEISIILNALNHQHKNKKLSEELQDIINRLVWAFHGPGRRADQ
jgi:hypothetical protein